MIINNKQYVTNLIDINTLRYLFFTNLYSDQNVIMQLSNIIQSHIELLDIEFIPTTFSFSIKIKKTAMRKVSKFVHEPKFYFAAVQRIFTDFIRANERSILEIIRSQVCDGNAEAAVAHLNYLYNNSYMLTNLCHVSCMADNIVIIKL